MNTFMKIYVLISLWLWAGMLFSKPLRKAFGEMHRRALKRIYDATWGQVVKTFKMLIDLISKRFKNATLYVENRSYELRVKVARSLVSKELIEELTQKNFVAAILTARQISRWRSDDHENFLKLCHLITGKAVSKEEKEEGVKAAFHLSGTGLFREIITRFPHAQERILLAFEQAEGDAPYDSIKNEEYRKFLRE